MSSTTHDLTLSLPRPTSRDEVREEEEYLRVASVLANQVWEGGPSSILFSSALRGEGATAAVLSVVRVLRQHYGVRAVAIELNRLHPTFSKMFDLDPSKSVSAIAAGEISPQEAVQQTPVGISVLPFGESSGGGKPARGISEVLRRMVAELNKDFDLVLIDCPAVLESVETLAAGRVVPRLVLVVEAGRTAFEVLERVKLELASEKIGIVGAILNKHRQILPRWLRNRLSRSG